MKNIDLNVGGLIGAIVCGGLAGAIIFSTADMSHNARGPIRLVIFALIGGAFAGNYFWGRIFNKPE